MKKRILSFVLLMLMVFTCFASAAEISYVAGEGDLSFTSVTFANDGTSVTASLSGIKAEGTDNVTLMMTMYNGKDKLIDAASSVAAVGTAETELKATLAIPSGDYKVAASLFNAENGLSPIAAPAYSDYEGSTDLVDLKVDGTTLEGFASGVYEYVYITEGATAYPEIGATVREGSTNVSVEYEDTFPGVATITVANAKGTVSSEYKIDFTPLRHIVVGATTDSDFVADAGSNLNLMSRNAVSAGIGSKNVYTNLTGADDDSLDFGSRWVTDYYPLGSHHAIRSVDSMLQGWDYFVSPNGAMKKDEGDYFEFEVNHNARVVVVAIASEASLTANGFEALPSKTYITASFITGGATAGVLADLTKLGITATFADMEFYNANKDNHTALCNYFVEKYNLDPDVAAENIPVNKPATVNKIVYNNAYSKFYEAYEDEPAKVIIPAPQATQSRGYIVAVIPVGEDGEIPDGGNQGGSEGGEAPDTPDVPDTPATPLGELKSLVGGMTYSQYIDYVNSVVPANKAMTKETTVSETQKLSTANNVLSTMAEEGKVCSVSSWRVFKNVAGGWEGLTFMTTDPSHYQNDSAKGWPMTMYSGKASSYSGDTCTGADNQIVPWWNIKVNEAMNVSIVTDKELAHLTEKGWTKLTIGTDIDNPFTIYDSRNGNPVGGANKYVYTKAFEAGDTVEIYNENTGLITYVPQIVVFDTPDIGGEGGDEPVVPDEPELAEGNHVIAGARYTDEIVADAGVTDGYKSAAAVTSEKTSRTDGIVYTNLRGNPDEASTVYGARLCTMPANSTSYHEVYYADETIAGNDYFVFAAGGNAHSDATLLKFDITADAEVYIVTTSNAMAFDGYTLEEKADGWVKGRFINRNMADAMNAVGVKPTYSVIKTYKPAEKDAFYNTHLKAAYEAANADAKAKFDEQWTLFGTAPAIGNDSAYKYAYKAVVTVPEGAEKAIVTVPGNTNTSASSRNILVVVKPAETAEEPDLSQDADVLAVIEEIDAIGTVTLDSEDAIVAAREAYDALDTEKQAYVTNLDVLEEAEAALEELKAEAEQPVPVEGDHIIVGARLEGEIVADAGVTDGYKSAAAVTSEKTSRTDGIVYTNLRGNPDEAGTVYGARLCTMPANRTSYHEVYYVDEAIEGSDYFVFAAGGNAHSDATLLKFDVVADAEVSILATSSAMAFDGFTLNENASGWIKGRFINRNMADAMNAIGVKPTYSVVKTYKPAEKDAFYNTYLKSAYDAADATAQATFDTQWATFGTASAIGNDSAYKAMYTATFRLPEGEDTMTITVPGNTSSATSRNILVLVKTAAPEAEIPAEVTAVIELIDAIGDVTLESEDAITAARTAYDELSSDNQLLVTNYSVLTDAETALEELKAAAEVVNVGTLTSKVSGLTYAKYLNYIESVTGSKPESTSVIKETDVIATSSIVVRDSFTVGNQIGSESARRKLETIHEDYAFLDGVKFFSPTIEWGQQDLSRRWFTKIFWGEDAAYTYNGFDYTVNAATDALPTVPWWTIPVTQATVYITSYVEMPHLEDAGWTKADSTEPVFTWKDTNNNNISNGPAVVYTKEVTDTETIELPNSNTGEVGTYPYFVFFVPNN